MALRQRFGPADKAAILVIALGEEIAADMFKAMDQQEVRVIAAAINRLGPVDQSVIESVLVEFLEILNSKNPSLSLNSSGFAGRALRLAFKGEHGEKLAKLIGKGAVKMRSLEITDPTTLARILQLEQAQTVAMVLAHATADRASQILRQMPEALRTDILMRIARLNPIDPDLIAEIDQHLVDEIEKMGSLQHRKIGGIKKVADILNHMEKSGQAILQGIEARSPDLSAIIRQEMFTFEDLIELDARGLQELVKAVPRSLLTLALRGVDASLQQLFFKSMSERAAAMLRDDIAALGSQKISEVQQAQRQVLDLLQKLVDDGKVVIDRQEKRVV